MPIINDPLYEPTETFTVTLSGPSAPATLARPTGTGTILDNPRVDIDPSLPGVYLADLDAGPVVSDYLLIANPHDVAVTARLTWVRPNGTDVRREFAVAAQQRVTVWVGGEPGIAGQGEVSVAVQSLDPGRPLDAEHSAYWGNWQAGRSTEGVEAATTWYLAEGATTIVDEWITVFNPTSSGPATVTLELFGLNGPVTPITYALPSSPGRLKFNIKDWRGSLDHGTRVTARTADGTLVPIVVERTMKWEWVAGQPEGHSTPGVSSLSADWYFAEGDMGFFATYYALLNPGASDATVRFTYLHSNGQTYTQDVVVPAQRRVTVYPGSVPAGGFGCHVAVLSGPPVAAERMLYGGPNWTISHAGVGTPQPATTWRFAEGANSPFFETYVLLANPNPTTAVDATLTFTKTDGTVVAAVAWVPAASRRNVWVKGLPGMETGDFRTVVTVPAGIPIVVERATYWPLTAGAALAAHLAGSTGAATLGAAPAAPEAAATSLPATPSFDPYSPALVYGPGPRLYERMLGYPRQGGAGLDTGPDPGPPETGARAAAAAQPLASTPLAATTSTVPWYGAHLTGGRRQ